MNMYFFNLVRCSIYRRYSVDALVAFPTTTGNEHKKAALMIRQSLDADSIYADIARHGNGLTALQTAQTYKMTTGAEPRTNVRM